MDTNSLGKLLSKSGIRAHILFLPEFTDLVDQTGQEKAVYSKLLKGLEMIEVLGDGLYNNKQFERLKRYGNLCSAHIDIVGFNGRILYFEDAGQIWLYSFFEKAGKRRTNYVGHAPFAISRRDAIKSSKDRSVLLWKM